MNLDEILKYERPKESLYDVLGCDQSSSVDQIMKEYKIKALQLHPDKNNEPESGPKFQRLTRAKEILTNPSSRRSYDIWLNSRINIPFDQWQGRQAHSMHWMNPKSTKLSINQGATSRQGSDHQLEKGNMPTGKSELLEKFRRYEV